MKQAANILAGALLVGAALAGYLSRRSVWPKVAPDPLEAGPSSPREGSASRRDGSEVAHSGASLDEARVALGIPSTAGRELLVVWEGTPPPWSSHEPTGVVRLQDFMRPGASTLQFTKGRGRFPEEPDALLSVHSVSAEGRLVHPVDRALRIDTAEESRVVLEITTDPWIEVIDEEDGSDVLGVEVLEVEAVEGRSVRPLHPHPGVSAEGPDPVRVGDSPIRWSSFPSSPRALLGAPGFVWTWATLDRESAEVRTIRLPRAGGLLLSVRGSAWRSSAALPRSGWELILRGNVGPEPVHALALVLAQGTPDGGAVAVDAILPGTYHAQLIHGSGADRWLGFGQVKVVAGKRSPLEILVSPADGLVQVPGTILMESVQEARRVQRVLVSRPGGSIPPQPGWESEDGASSRVAVHELVVGGSIRREGALLQWEDLLLHPGEHVFQIEPQWIFWAVLVEDSAVHPIHLSLEKYSVVEVDVIREGAGTPEATLHAFSNLVILDDGIHGAPERFTRGGRYVEWQAPLELRIPVNGVAVLGLMSQHETGPLPTFRVVNPLAGPRQTLRLKASHTIDLELRSFGHPRDMSTSWWGSVLLEDRTGTRAGPATVEVITRAGASFARRVRLGYDGLCSGPYVLHLPAGTGRAGAGIALPQESMSVVADAGLGLARARLPEDG